jgi:citrate lyase subunit beta/citryl-CoA lyase
MKTIAPRRSVLYMPSNNDRAIAKAPSLGADTLILDLEDAVAPEEKSNTRAKLVELVQTQDFGQAERIVRVNGADTQWGEADLRAFANAKIDALCIPKVESMKDVDLVLNILESAGDTSTKLWVMAETPMGVQSVEQIVGASDRICALMMGTSDLMKDLRLPHTVKRQGLLYSLSKCVLAARVAGIDIIDGVFIDLKDDTGFRHSCEQARELGFDGKSVIHPKQIADANEVFGPNNSALEEATEIVEAWEQCKINGDGVTVVRGKLVEALHVEQAQRLLEFQAEIERRAK